MLHWLCHLDFLNGKKEREYSTYEKFVMIT